MANLVLSIIIPMYNASEYIQSCLDSIIEYTGKEVEIIVVDDGSKDDSLDKVSSVRDDRIKLFTQKNMGPSSARNKGINNSRGEFIMFVDSDDWLEKGSVSKIIKYLKNTAVDTLIFNTFVFYKTHKAKKIMSLQDRYTPSERIELEKTLLSSFELSSPWAKAYSMEIIKNNNILFPEDIRYYEDILFNIEYFSYSKYGYFINEYIYNYRDNQNSLSRKFNFMQLDNLIHIYKVRIFYYENYFLKNYNYKAKFKKHIDDNFIRCLFLNIVTAKKNKINNSEITNYIQANKDITSLIKSKSYLNIGTRFRAALIRNRYYNFLPLNILVKMIIGIKYIIRRHSK